MKNIGEAVKEQTLDPKKNLVLLGVANWTTIRNNHLLINTADSTKYTESLAVNFDGKQYHKRNAALQPNHTHFMLVDSSQLNVYGGEIELRNEIEKAVSEYDYESQAVKKKKKNADKTALKTTSGQKVPIVLIVVGGGPLTFESCRTAVENGSPVLFIEGSGRCADICADIYKKIRIKYNEQKSEDVETCIEPSGYVFACILRIYFILIVI